MTNYRKFLYKSQAVVFSTLGFIALAQYSLWYQSPEGQRYAMNELHRQIAIEEHMQRREAIMSLWNISENDLQDDVNIFGEKL